LEGYVADRDGHKLTVELRGGISVESMNEDHKEGEKVVVGVRPEVLSIKKGEHTGLNSIGGNIEGFRFEGNNVRYEIRLKNDDMVLVVRPALMGEWYNVGEKVTVAFPVEKSFVFTYPERGLRTELALE
jgi:ABC-type Fe3+/spermidine/putrescine transport system ATPase subunit